MEVTNLGGGHIRNNVARLYEGSNKVFFISFSSALLSFVSVCLFCGLGAGGRGVEFRVLCFFIFSWRQKKWKQNKKGRMGMIRMTIWDGMGDGNKIILISSSSALMCMVSYYYILLYDLKIDTFPCSLSRDFSLRLISLDQLRLSFG